MPKSERRVETVYPRNRSEWRRWLQDNHATTRRGSSTTRKVAASRTSLYDEAVEEARFWLIDSRPTLDEERWMQLFSPETKSPGRGSTSNESRS